MKTSAGRSSESFLAQYERRIGNIFLATATLLLLPSIYLERSHRDAVATGSNRNPIRKRNRLARVTSRVPVIGTAVSTVATLSSTTRRRVKVKQWHQVSGTTFFFILLAFAGQVHGSVAPTNKNLARDRRGQVSSDRSATGAKKKKKKSAQQKIVIFHFWSVRSSAIRPPS